MARNPVALLSSLEPYTLTCTFTSLTSKLGLGKAMRAIVIRGTACYGTRIWKTNRVTRGYDVTGYSLLLVALEARKERNVGIRETVQIYS